MSKDEYLITDPPLKALTVFAMPMILGSFFQQVYNMADSIIVGQFVGSSALAAVGACAALTNVFICVALGAGVGAGVLVSRCFGAKNYGRMKTIVSTSLISFLSLSVVLGVFGQLILLVEKLLVLTEHFSEFHGWFLLLSILSPHSVQAACIFFCRSSCLDIGLQHSCPQIGHFTRLHSGCPFGMFFFIGISRMPPVSFWPRGQILTSAIAFLPSVEFVFDT